MPFAQEHALTHSLLTTRTSPTPCLSGSSSLCTNLRCWWLFCRRRESFEAKWLLMALQMFTPPAFSALALASCHCLLPNLQNSQIQRITINLTRLQHRFLVNRYVRLDTQSVFGFFFLSILPILNFTRRGEEGLYHSTSSQGRLSVSLSLSPSASTVHLRCLAALPRQIFAVIRVI